MSVQDRAGMYSIQVYTGQGRAGLYGVHVSTGQEITVQCTCLYRIGKTSLNSTRTSV